MRYSSFVIFESTNKIVKKNIHKYNANKFYDEVEIEKESKKILK